ncbi:MAG: hypothetical protein KBA30_00805 [Clostridia bacterium]|nr:hypothetical protein [Clostridia bacterium]
MPGRPAADTGWRLGRVLALAAWTSALVVSLVLAGWTGLRRTSLISEFSYTGRDGITSVATLAGPASDAASAGGAVLVMYPVSDPPVGMLSLLDDLARGGFFAMTCAVPEEDGIQAIAKAMGAFADRSGIPTSRTWIIGSGAAAATALQYAAEHAAGGVALLDPGSGIPVKNLPAQGTPVGIFAAGNGSDGGADSLIALYESLSGEDATLAHPTDWTGSTFVRTYLAPDGGTRLSVYPDVPAGIGLTVPVYLGDVLRWMSASGPDGQSGSASRLLLPLDAGAVFLSAALSAGLVFGSLSRLLPRGDRIHAASLYGFLAAGAVLLAGVAFGLAGRLLWSRPLMRWESVAAGAVLLVARLPLFGSLSLSRGWSASTDRFVNRWLEVADLGVFLVVSGGVALLDGLGFFACVSAAFGALCAWGLTRATGGLSRSLSFSHLAGAILLAALV